MITRMHRHRWIAAIVLFVIAAPFTAQAVIPLSTERLARIKPGQWIQLEGQLQRDQTVICSEIKMLSGNILEDDWSLRGPVKTIDARAKTFVIGKYSIRLSDRVEFDSPTNLLKSLAGLKSGMLVEVEGTYQKDGTFLAHEVSDESEKLARKPGIEKKIQIVAKVEKISSGDRTIQAMGTPFLVTDKTQFKSVIK